MTSLMMTHTLVLRFAGKPTGDYDDLGRPIIGPPSDEEWSAWWEPRAGSENLQASEQQIWGFWVYLPEDAPLSSADAVVIEGVEYEVVGEPGRQPGGFILDGYISAAVERGTG